MATALTPVDEALEALHAAAPAVGDTAEVAVSDALGRVLAAAARARANLPPFDQSAMDGYAVRAADVQAASEASPASLRVVATSAAGADPRALPGVGVGEAVRIFTGAPLPPGANAVVVQEVVERTGDRIVLRAPVRVGANVRRRGEEVGGGSEVVPAGKRLAVGDVAALAACGVASVCVVRPPRVYIVTTGDEVELRGGALRPGRVADVNGPTMVAWCKATGVALTGRCHVPDDASLTLRVFERALDDADVVLCAGGVSVGERDLVPSALEAAGVRRVFHGVAHKPGKPLYFGVCDRTRTAVLALPGNPAAVFTSLFVFGAALLDALEGAQPSAPHWREGTLAAPVRRDRRRVRWVRCSVRWGDGAARLHPVGQQASHMVTGLAGTDALARVEPGGEPVPAGKRVRWLGLRLSR